MSNVLEYGGKRIDIDQQLLDISRAECEESLAEFVRQAWHVIEPGQPYVHGWHIDFICEHLEAITYGVEIDGKPYNRVLVNIPPGPGWVENLVMTDRGRVRLGDIKPGDMVLTHRGRFRRVSACYSKGMLDTLVVRTRSGREMVLTPDHNVLTPDGWIEARDLAVGSTLAVVTPSEGLSNNFATPEEARLLGYLIGDGSITQATVSFTNHDLDTLEDFERCAASMGFSTKRGKVSGLVRIHGGQRVHDWLESHGLFRASSYDKHIPDAVLRSGNEIIRNFIGAYWSCDGMFDVRATKSRGSSYRASATTVSKRLAEDLLHALTRIGIRSVLRPKARKLNTAAQPGGVYRSYNIEVYAEEDTARFIDMPGLSARKNALARMCAKRRFDSALMEDPVVEILPGGERECMCISVDEDHSLTWSDIAVHNTMKSLILNVFWPAWEWGPQNMPHLRYVCAAHKVENLSARDSRRMRQLITSDWYIERWGDRVSLAKDQNEKLNFHNRAGGFRIATAITSLTGIRGDRVLIDDPHSVDSAASDTQRQAEVDTFLEAIPTRLNNPEESAIVVIMQRLHESDVSGVILDKGLGYDHIMLPMRYDPLRAHTTKLGLDDPRQEEGELLFPARFPLHVVERDEKAMGPYASAGQFQQEPTPRGGGVIKAEWWETWPDGAYPPMDFIVASLDPAYTAKQENDYSALTVWGVYTSDNSIAQVTKVNGYDGITVVDERIYTEGAPRVMLMAAWQERLELHDLVEKVSKTCRKMRVDVLLVEAKASGLSVAQEIRRLYGHETWGVQLINPGAMDKLARLYSIQHLFSEGMITAPDRTWADQVIRQCEVFPKGKHDDLCLVGGTLITMGDGSQKPIKNVVEGDSVATPAGPRTVLASSFTGVKPIWRLSHQFGSLEGTGSHPVFANGEWKELERLCPYDTLSLYQYGDRSSWALRKKMGSLSRRLSSMATDTIAIRSRAIQRTVDIFHGRDTDYIATFGNFIMAPFQRGIKFITSMATLGIMTYQTLSVFHLGCTERSITMNTSFGESLKSRLPIFSAFGKKPRLGTLVKKAANGIGRTLLIPFASPERQSLSAKVITLASAFGAAKLLSQKVLRKLHALRRVKHQSQNTSLVKAVLFTHTMRPVFNLTVEGEHCYYANGILTHNCDTVSQALRHLRDIGLLTRAPERIAELEQGRRHVGSLPPPLYPV